MDKIKSNMHRGNKHFVLGLSFVVFAFIASIYWGLTFAEDMAPITTSTTTSGTTNTIENIKPLAPTNLTATVDGNKVILNWVDNSDNEAGFKIYRGPVWTDIGNVDSNVTTFTDSGRGAGTYTYRLNAFNSLNGVYSYSSISNDVSVTVQEIIVTTNPIITNPTTTSGTTTYSTTTTDYTTTSGTTTTNTNTTTAPPAPTNFRISTTTLTNAVSLLWNNNSSLQDAIKIQRKLSSALSWADLVSLSGMVSYYTDSVVAIGTYYDYRIQSCILGLCSPYISLEKISVANTGTINNTTTLNNTTIPAVTTTPTSTTITTTDTVKPLAPTNLTAKVDGNKVILNWVDNSDNEAGFKIYRGPVWTDIGNVGPNVRSFTDFGRVAGTYTYRLNAFNASYMYSSLSNDVSVTITGTTTTPSITSPTVLPVISPTTSPVLPTTTPKTITPPPTTTINPTVIKTGVDTYPANIVTTGTTTTPKTETTATTQMKEPMPVETPKQIINNVTDALNILFRSNEKITGVTNTTNSGAIGTTTGPINNGDVKVERPDPTPEQIAKEEKAKEEIVKLVYKDTNKDGISDYDSKYVYNMDPVKPSPVSTFEGKSITAGEKILLGFDPGKKELEKVVVEEPTTEAKPEIVVASYRVNEVSFVDATPVEETEVNKETTTTKETVPTEEIKPTKIIKLKGIALPNSFITLYIYSTPIMVTVKTDSNGEWQYTMDKELEDGEHTVYTATVNNTGNIVAKSTPFTFVKTAEAVTLQDIVPVQVTQAAEVEKPGFLETKNIFIIIIGILMLAGVTLTLIGLLSKKTTQ